LPVLLVIVFNGSESLRDDARDRVDCDRAGLFQEELVRQFLGLAAAGAGLLKNQRAELFRYRPKVRGGVKVKRKDIIWILRMRIEN
jgi:hypothetical protein